MDIATQLHLASQYLAMAGKSFLPQKDDDSHTNLGFFSEDNTLRTWDLNDSGIYLAFRFDDFSLQWGDADGKIAFALDGKNHDEIISWITKMASASKLEKIYNYDLHYELPYSPPVNFRFNSSDLSELDNLLQLRILAQNVLKEFLDGENLQSDIRIWPHHFDTGAFFELNDNSGKSIGLGMAIPDSVCNQHYFYMSGYLGHDALETNSFSKLSYGQWKNNGFKGAILNTSKTNKQQAVEFFKEAFKAFVH
jgi:hypothetical protein